ncbi:Integral membrane protein [Pleurostoma richardsiae]|uniref:Integral membrane protein n=1 Tax=Pleurostoma richardsiae TaxID=41990 RepID=A0AA38RIT6_9PEZI|nr:Integral membrane protein [Pleurostoma richardsiae]
MSSTLLPNTYSAPATIIASRPEKRRQRVWTRGIPPLLRPLIRAYLLGYASAVAPKLLTLVIQHLTRKHKGNHAANGTKFKDEVSFQESARRILVAGLDWRRFPTFCATMIGGSTLLEVPLNRLFSRVFLSVSELTRKRLSRWFASFISAWFSLRLLQSKQSAAFTETVAVKANSPSGLKFETVRYAGRTLDLSLFAATRALDVVIGELWARRRSRRTAASKWSRVDEAISQLTDPAVFALSSAFIMWTWIYRPDKLPRAYNKWIASAASVDSRLIVALQRCRDGELQYGKDTGQAPLLQSMCADYKWPLEWGDPSKAIPFPCEMVHMGCGPSCEYHALSRFGRSFLWAMSTYLPLNLLLVARRPSLKSTLRALLSASRSSAFLGAFIALFYYGVCLARARLGPRLLGRGAAAAQRIDAGVCVGSGCTLCGWSVLLESASRRRELGLFVAPRALATRLPRRYGMEKQWRETLVYAVSTAVVFTCVLENKRRVRGVLGKVLGTVLEAS